MSKYEAAGGSVRPTTTPGMTNISETDHKAVKDQNLPLPRRNVGVSTTHTLLRH